MRINYDPDEYKGVHTHRPCTVCNGDLRKCNGGCNGSSSWSSVRRTDEEIREIKAKRRREHEDEILREAELIKARRKTTQ